MTDGVLAWHFLQQDGHLKHIEPLRYVKVGDVVRHEGAILICHSGLHASRRLLDALYYAESAVLTRVECFGIAQEQNNKLVCRERRVVGMLDATRLLHEFACDQAEAALRGFADGTVDQRNLDAIRCKRLWLEGEATDEQLAAAGGAAAWTAAWTAARAAARAAAWDAAAWTAAWDAANEELEKRVLAEMVKWDV